jgi:hypothetical protein
MPDIHFLYPILLFLCLTVAGRHQVWLASAIGLAVALLWCLLIYGYLIFPSYIDHVQPSIAAVSWLAVHGHPIWPNWETGDVYGMIYGPLLYLLTGVFLLIDPSILMSKLPGLAAFFGAVVCLWWALRQKKADRITTFFLITAFLIALIALDPTTPRLFIGYENHADVFLIFLATLTLPVAFEWPAQRSAIGVGILAGLCAGFKVHGFLYAIPAALAVIARAKDQREGLRFAGVGGGAALAVIVLPFLVSPAAGAVDYLSYLLMSTHHGLAMREVSDGLLIAVSLAVPLFVVWHWRRPVLGRPERWFLIGLAGAVAATFVFVAKRGDGPHHLWPLFPPCFYGMACILGADSRARDSLKPQTIMAVVVLALFVTYAGWLETSYYVSKLLYERQDIELAKIADVENILKDYPDAQFGVSDDLHYYDSFYKVLGVFQGAPLRLDIPSWLDLAFAGIPEKVVARAIEHCAARTWVLPLGEPFVMLNWYTQQPLFSDKFREEFHNNYRLVREDDFYQVWACK